MKPTMIYNPVDGGFLPVHSISPMNGLEVVHSTTAEGNRTLMKKRIDCIGEACGETGRITLLELENSVRLDAWQKTQGDDPEKLHAADAASKRLHSYLNRQ